MLEIMNAWRKEFEVELGRIAFQELKPYEKLRETVAAAESALQCLRIFVVENCFENVAEEIWFFKTLKPQVECWKVYAADRYRVETSPLSKTYHLQLKELLLRIKHIEGFFCHHGFFYRYYRQGDTALDELLFLRGSFAKERMLLPKKGRIYPNFCTNGDQLFARFLAAEKMVSFLQQQISALDGLDPVTLGK